jgi:fumigallin biosynthesis monooxygenase-like protein
MAQTFNQKMMAEIDGDFVVFLIGMRINKPWKIHKWLPVALAMPKMIKELEANPEAGLLGYQQFLPGPMVQYWRSFEHLERYARSKDQQHWPAWVDFNKKVRIASGDVGIWHETYRVAAGQYECVYGAVPRMGLAKAARHVPVAGVRDSARGRMEAVTRTSV